MKIHVGSAEWAALAFKLWWTLRIGLPDAWFNDYGRPYQHLTVLPDEFWASLAVANIFVHSTGVAIARPVLRRAMLFLDVIWWGFLAVRMTEHAPKDITVGFILIAAFLAAAAYREVTHGAT